MTVKEFRAEDGTRTRYLQLGKLSLCQVSYFRFIYFENRIGKSISGMTANYFLSV